ncbi:MAG: hypothetical protein HY356_02315 [Gammaproteobacteria bacterium]|nr:hypothetical protein [Gammaproteobacteria bacterium]
MKRTYRPFNLLCLFTIIILPYSVFGEIFVTNANYPQNEHQSRWDVDVGRCTSEALSAYPEPSQVEDPNLRNRTRRFSGYSSSGESFSGYAYEGGINSPQDYRDYQNYKKDTSELPEVRSKYIASCLEIKGWQAHSDGLLGKNMTTRELLEYLITGNL